MKDKGTMVIITIENHILHSGEQLCEIPLTASEIMKARR